MKKILIAVGTRPEAIKLAPIILGLQAHDHLDVVVLATAQHRGLLDQVLEFFDITPSFDLDLMQANQSLSDLTSRVISGAAKVIQDSNPDLVIVQGDTTTVLGTSLAAFYAKVPVAHIEAGLRTFDLQNPFPEEMNRVITTRLSSLHFAPTESSKTNLVNEGVRSEAIVHTGNTVIDALFLARSRIVASEHEWQRGFEKYVLVTTHRRENFGEPLARILQAVRDLAHSNREVAFVFPVHPNPQVTDLVHTQLAGRENVFLLPPQDYPSFVELLDGCSFVMSDSGGVQEEAPALGKPVLVLREDTERPEAVEQGMAALVGSDPKVIFEMGQKLLHDSSFYASMAKGHSPFGDGKAAARTVDYLVQWLA